MRIRPVIETGEVAVDRVFADDDLEPGRSERRRAVVETQVRLMPPMAVQLTGCEAQWVEDVWAGRQHEHRRRA